MRDERDPLSLTADRLCETFHSRAVWTQEMIAKGLSFRLGVLEESLTDFHLIQIAAAHPDCVVTRKFSRRTEGATSGADWLWCIGGPGAWLCLLVQAKIVNPQTGKCHYLHYKNQRRLLQDYARRHRLLPVYCIYGLVMPGDLPAPRLEKGLPLEPEQWSCSLVRPRIVRVMAKESNRTHTSLLAEGVPWKMLFCHGRGTTLAHTVAESWATYGRSPSDSGDEKQVARQSSSRRRVRWDDPDPTILVSEQFPQVIERLLDPRNSKAPVAGVSLLSAVPIPELNRDMRLLEPPRSERLEWWEMAKARWIER